MNKEKIKKDQMKPEYVKQISSWKYEGEYRVYNMPSLEETKEKGYSILKEEKVSNYLCYLIEEEVIAYVNMKEIENKVMIGIGLKPEYCGQGYGNYFLKDSLEEIKRRFPGHEINLEVRSWNQRAIRSYQKIGFQEIKREMKKDRFGNDCEFVIMKY